MKPGSCAVRRSLKSMLFVVLSVIGLDGAVAGDCGCRRPAPFASVVAPAFLPTPVLIPGRSGEHTSELQSLAYLVCRLLL